MLNLENYENDILDKNISYKIMLINIEKMKY